jgi:hypothetical protein
MSTVGTRRRFPENPSRGVCAAARAVARGIRARLVWMRGAPVRLHAISRGGGVWFFGVLVRSVGGARRRLFGAATPRRQLRQCSPMTSAPISQCLVPAPPPCCRLRNSLAAGGDRAAPAALALASTALRHISGDDPFCGRTRGQHPSGGKIVEGPARCRSALQVVGRASARCRSALQVVGRASARCRSALQVVGRASARRRSALQIVGRASARCRSALQVVGSGSVRRRSGSDGQQKRLCVAQKCFAGRWEWFCAAQKCFAGRGEWFCAAQKCFAGRGESVCAMQKWIRRSAGGVLRDAGEELRGIPRGLGSTAGGVVELEVCEASGEGGGWGYE